MVSYPSRLKSLKLQFSVILQILHFCPYIIKQIYVKITAFCWKSYLDIVEREEADHSIVFSFEPVLVNLTPHEYNVPSSEAELPATHIHSIILPCSHYDTRLVSILILRTFARKLH